MSAAGELSRVSILVRTKMNMGTFVDGRPIHNPHLEHGVKELPDIFSS